jgi:hypothetical protein
MAPYRIELISFLRQPFDLSTESILSKAEGLRARLRASPLDLPIYLTINVKDARRDRFQNIRSILPDSLSYSIQCLRALLSFSEGFQSWGEESKDEW